MNLVSIYPHIKETVKGEHCNLADILDAIRSGQWKEKIEALRDAVKNGESEKKLSSLKSKLPYFTGSGTFGSNRDLTNFQKHSGRLIIDFDKVKDIEATRQVLIEDKYSEYVFVSCTGRGYAAVVKIDPLKHLESFLFLEKYYLENYGLQIDKACKDIPRPRYISYDPDLFKNTNADFVELPSISIDDNEEKYEWIVNTINKKNSYIEGNRHHYLVVLCHFLNKCGVPFYFAFDKVINQFSNDDKSPDEIEKIIKYCYQNEIDHGTFTINKKIKDLPQEFSEGIKKIFKYAHGVNQAGRNYNEEDVNQMCQTHLVSLNIVRSIFKKVSEDFSDEFNLDEQPEIYKIELFIKKRYDIKKNEVLQQIEFKDKAKENEEFKIVNSDTINRELQYAKFKFPLDRVKSLMRSNYVETYNPFKNYFESLPEWHIGNESEGIIEGKDFITELADFVTTDNQQFWRVQFKKALVRSIACSLGGRENRIVMTLIGADQETGKTSFIRFLCPPALKKYYTETAMDGGKDSDMQLSENMFWNLEELSALTNIEINKLKAIISKLLVKQRGSYKEFAETHPRRVNFWASTNKDEFLTDDQNTRWLCFNIKNINHDYNNFKTNVRQVNIDHVWAQAYALYKTGFDYSLNKEEAAQRDEINKTYELSSTEKELILTHYKTCDAGAGAGKFMHITEVLIDLSSKTDYKINLKPYAISKALKQLGFIQTVKKVHGKPVRGYYITSSGLFPGQTDIEYDKDSKIKPF